MDFERLMTRLGGKAFIPERTGEIVYRIPLPNDLSIWVYSTINPKKAISRAKGTDAIRTLLKYRDTKIVLREPKTLRTENWEVLLQKKIESLKNMITPYKCPWGHPLIKKRKRSGTGYFFGCANYPDCKYLYKGEKKLSEVFDPKNIPPN